MDTGTNVYMVVCGLHIELLFWIPYGYWHKCLHGCLWTAHRVAFFFFFFNINVLLVQLADTGC